MNNKFNNVVGHREYFQITNDKWVKVGEDHNMIVNEASDILANALSGDAIVNGMYLCFENSDTTNYVESKNNDASYYGNEATDRGIVRVSTLGDPIFSTTEDKYSANRITFIGVTDGSSMFSSSVQDGSSVFYHSALVAISDIENQSSDKIFSCGNLSTPITKIAGSQIGIKWTITFTTP